MGKIVAIGGGEIGRPREGGGCYPVETLKIDNEIIRLSAKMRPRLLFIPTASNDSTSYFKIVKRHFGSRLGCSCDVLYLIDSQPTMEEITLKILNSDIIYVGGGKSTLKMLQIWRRKGVDKILKKAYEENVILSGLSAGAICWFRYGSSDSRLKADKGDSGYVRIKGLNLIPVTLSPHHVVEAGRRSALIKMMKRTSGVGIALDDRCALEIVESEYRIISERKTAKAHKVYFCGNILHYDEIKKTREFVPLELLYEKN